MNTCLLLIYHEKTKWHVLCFKGNGKWLILVFFDPSVHRIFCWCREKAEAEKICNRRCFVVVQQSHIKPRFSWVRFISLPLAAYWHFLVCCSYLRANKYLPSYAETFQWLNDEQKYCCGFFFFIITIKLASTCSSSVLYLQHYTSCIFHENAFLFCLTEDVFFPLIFCVWNPHFKSLTPRSVFCSFSLPMQAWAARAVRVRLWLRAHVWYVRLCLKPSFYVLHLRILEYSM